MPLAVGPFTGLAGLMQILLWILVGFLFLSFVVTVILHYRRGRKKELDPDDLQKLAAYTPEGAGFMMDDESCLLFDHSGLIRDYKSRLVRNHAQYAALRQDFEELEDRYNALLMKIPEHNETLKTITMEESNVQDQEINPGSGASPDAMERLQTGESAVDLTQGSEESPIQREEFPVLPTKGEGEIQLPEQESADISDMKELQVAKAYMDDLLNEKNLQINFLQQQLEQRVRNYHHAGRELAATKDELQQVRQLLENARAAHLSLQAGWDKREEEMNSLQVSIAGKEVALSAHASEMQAKQDHITWLESSFREIRDQNELLQAALGDQQQKNELLQQELEEEKSKMAGLEKKLAANRQLMVRMYREFSACLEEEDKSSPVIPLESPVVSMRDAVEWEGSVVQ